LDKLEHIFELQHAFDSELAARRGLDPSDKAEWLRREMVALIVEASEVLDEANYKWWKDARPLDHARILDELADILHFYVAACLKMGFDAQDIYQAYLAKNRENFNRQRGLAEKEGYGSGSV